MIHTTTTTTTAPGGLDASAETAIPSAKSVAILLATFMAGMALGGYLAWIG